MPTVAQVLSLRYDLFIEMLVKRRIIDKVEDIKQLLEENKVGIPEITGVLENFWLVPYRKGVLRIYLENELKRVLSVIGVFGPQLDQERREKMERVVRRIETISKEDLDVVESQLNDILAYIGSLSNK